MNHWNNCFLFHCSTLSPCILSQISSSYWMPPRKSAISVNTPQHNRNGWGRCRSDTPMVGINNSNQPAFSSTGNVCPSSDASPWINWSLLCPNDIPLELELLSSVVKVMRPSLLMKWRKERVNRDPKYSPPCQTVFHVFTYRMDWSSASEIHFFNLWICLLQFFGEISSFMKRERKAGFSSGYGYGEDFLYFIKSNRKER